MICAYIVIIIILIEINKLIHSFIHSYSIQLRRWTWRVGDKYFEIFPTNKNMKQFPVILNNENIEFVEDCCLLGLKISTDIQNRNIEAWRKVARLIWKLLFGTH